MKTTLLASLIVALLLTGCNTVRGIGKDVSGAGKAVSNTAERTQNEIHR